MTSGPVTSGPVVAAVLLCAGVVVLGAGCTIALGAVEPSWSWRHSMISDLGSRTCVSRQVGPGAYRMCSPRWAWFDAAAAVSGACLLAAAAVRCRSRPGVATPTTTAVAATVAMAVMGAGLVLMAVVPSSTNHAAHMAAAVLCLPVPAAVVLVGALRRGRGEAGSAYGAQARAAAPGRRPWGSRAPTVAAVVALVACLDHLPGDAAAPVPRGIAELVSAGCLLAVLLAETVADLRGPWGRSGSLVPEPLPDRRPAATRRRARRHR